MNGQQLKQVLIHLLNYCAYIFFINFMLAKNVWAIKREALMSSQGQKILQTIFTNLANDYF